MPVSFRPAAEHRKINDVIRGVQLQALRLWYVIEAAGNDGEKNNREDREFMQDE